MKEPTFDIFSRRSDNEAIWIQAVQGLSKARERMEQIAAQNPGKYFLFSPREPLNKSSDFCSA